MSGSTITASSTAGYYLGSTSPNPIAIAAGVTISNAGTPAMYSLLATYWTIVNSGTLLATGKSAFSDGILLSAGGSVTNAASGSITGYYVGVSVASAGTVVNQGTIATTGTSGTGYIYSNNAFTATSAGVLLGTGGVSNAGSGLIAGYFEGVAIKDGGSVVNAGTISAASKSDGYGIVLPAGGTVTNLENASVLGGVGGILAFGQASTVVNQGGITGAGNIGIALIAGGAVSNAPGGVIQGGQIGILSQGGDPLALTNDAGGIISGGQFGLFDGAGGVATVANDGTIVGAGTTSVGIVMLGGGTIGNEAPGRIAGGEDGIFTYGSTVSTVTNAGTVSGQTYTGAWLKAGGALTNSGGISGRYFGVKISNAAGTVVNTGSISETRTLSGAGVQLADGGVVTNSTDGYIASQFIGVQIGSATASPSGTVFNQGSILAADVYGDGAGVWIHGPGAITNAPGGLISGGLFGIVAYNQTTVVNQGTIFGTNDAFYAKNAGFADRVIDLPGGVFYGTVNGGNTLGSTTVSTFELGSGSSIGTIADMGTIVDFGQIALDPGAAWSLGGPIAAQETIAFGGSDASLILTSPSAAAATITGFAATGTIQLSGITDVTGLSWGPNNVLDIAESNNPGLTLQFDAQPNVTYSTGATYTDITVIPCFLPGTYILTDRGEIVVENLQVGDSIVTHSGTKRRLCWIGHGRALAARGRRNAATPVILRKGALADNVPHRDLHITKGHSLYLDGALIPVEFLVNHRSILWDDRAQEVTVFHLELDAHDVLIANGAEAESYRDDGNRWLFQNANADWDQPPKPPCAPVLTGGPLVDAIWRRLLDRAGPRPGVPLTGDPDLHLLVDGRRLDASGADGAVHVFRLTGRPGSVRIASRDVIPAELGLARDPRSLGVAIRRVAVRQGTKFVVLKASDECLADGFHPYEAAEDLRWTNGDAALPADVFARFTGAIEVVIHLAATTQYPARGGDAGRAAA